jgi:hypothetical protein
MLGLFCPAGEMYRPTAFTMLGAILPPYSLSRMKVIVFRYKENNNYHLGALRYLERIVRLQLPLEQFYPNNV